MATSEALLVFLLCAVIGTTAFKVFLPDKIQRSPLRLAESSDVSRVLVCTSDLCRCQEDERGGAMTVLSELLARDLPYPVEESACLGSCGIGSVVSVEFSDGKDIIAYGMDETLAELGLGSMRRDEAAAAVEILPVANLSEKGTPSVVRAEDYPTKFFCDDGVYAPEDATVKMETTETGRAPESNPVVVTTAPNAIIVLNHSARDRMRAESAKLGPPSNPWGDVAAYLFKKAVGE